MSEALLRAVREQGAMLRFKDAIFHLRKRGTPPTAVSGPHRITELRYSAELCDATNCLKTISFPAGGMEEAREILAEVQVFIDETQ